jgi:hypothetical protein
MQQHALDAYLCNGSDGRRVILYRIIRRSFARLSSLVRQEALRRRPRAAFFDIEDRNCEMADVKMDPSFNFS